MVAARPFLQLLCPHKQTRSIYEMEERAAAFLARQGLTPSDRGRIGRRADAVRIVVGRVRAHNC